MLNSIVTRQKMLSPLSETEKTIIRSATRLFLQNGFSKTTLKMIADDTGIRQGTLCYHFHTKEDMLYLLIQELMDFHGDMVEQAEKETGDLLFSYAAEVTAQLVLCEVDERAYDLYYSAYSHPGTLALIKDWSAGKNYQIFKDRLPDWTEADFARVEHVASAIEFAAFTAPCDRYFTIKDKARLVLDSLLKLYEVEKEERVALVERILAVDFLAVGKEMFEKFVRKLDNTIEDAV